MRSFKPALARDYDVFFAAIGLLCGGILFFQGWRLDPILQFGQFLLAGTTVFFAYESVRLRGVATDQARRSSFFDEDPLPERMPNGGLRGGWDGNDSYEQFEERVPLRRRFSSQDNIEDQGQDDFYRPRRTSRAAIPEQAASRRPRFRQEDGSMDVASEKARRMARFAREEDVASRPSATFGERRSSREDQRRGSRPSSNQQTASRRRSGLNDSRSSERGTYQSSKPGVPQGSPIRVKAEDAAFTSSSARTQANNGRDSSSSSQRKNQNDYKSSSSSRQQIRSNRPSQRSPRERDNSSRFDD